MGGSGQGAGPGVDGFSRPGHPASAPGVSHLRETTSRSGIGPRGRQRREGSCLIKGTAWATRTSRVGRAAEGDAARKFVPLGLSGLASFVTVSRGHRPNCKSGGMRGRRAEPGQHGCIANPVMADCSKQWGKEAKPQVVTERVRKYVKQKEGEGWEQSC